MHAGVCVTLRNAQRDSTPTSSGANLRRAIYEGKHRRRSRTGTCQDGATGKPGFPARADGRAMERRAAASRINGLSCRRRCRREGEGKRESGMNYDGSVSQRQENVGRYILRNIPILWAAPAPSDERKGASSVLSG